MSSPKRIPRDQRLVDYHDQVRRRSLRICGWLGMGPDRVFKLVDEDPNEYGEVEVWWESMAPELPTRGKVIKTGARGTWGEPTIHSGTLVLHPIDAEELREVAGPKPQMFTPDERRRPRLEPLPDPVVPDIRESPQPARLPRQGRHRQVGRQRPRPGAGQVTDVRTCTHETTEPVDVRDHSTGGTTTVAHVCTVCLDALPAAWGCPDCQWIEERRLCDPVPSLLLGQPCAVHAREG